MKIQKKKKRCHLGRPRMKKWREKIVIWGYVQFGISWKKGYLGRNIQ